MLKIIKLKSILISLVALLWASSAVASIADVSENLMGPTEIITKLVVIACYIVGVGLIIFALAQYKQHRQSPKLVPLTTPILLLILGVLAIVIPYFSIISGQSFSASEQAKREGKMPDKSGAFSPNLPDVEKRSRPGPGRYAPDGTDDQGSVDEDDEYYEEDYEDEGDEDYEDEGDGHWTDE